MIKSRKVFFWAGAISGGILLLLCLLLLAAPLFINLEGVHKEIEARFHRETGGKGTFQTLDLHFLPRPHAVIHKGKFSFPNQNTLVFETLTVYPQLLPLLTGELRLARVELSSPQADIDLPASKKDPNSSTFLSDTVGQWKIPSALRNWIGKTIGFKILIENGLLNVSTRENSSFQFSDINISTEPSAASLTLQLTCASNFFAHMNLKAQIETNSFTTTGDLGISGFKISELPDTPQNQKTMTLKDGMVDFQMNFTGKSLENLKANVNLSTPSLTLRGQRRIMLKGIQMEGDIQLENGILIASLSHMTLDYPRMILSGLFKREKEDTSVSLQLEGKDVDVPAVRSCALTLANDISAVKDIFAIIRDGYVPFISVTAKGKSMADLGNLKNYDIKGHMRKGKISITNLRINLDNVAGTALISNGILRGQRLRANLGKINGKDGILTVGLKESNAPFYLNIQVNADLAESHTLLKRLVTKGAFSKWLNHIRTIKGKATASLKLNETKAGLLVDVDCSDCRLKGHYRPLPLPLTVKSGGFHYGQNHLRLRELAGTYGRSEFLLTSGLFDWRDEPQLEITAAKATVFLEQIHPLLSTMETSTQWLKKLYNIEGRLSLDSLRLKGPLKNPCRLAVPNGFRT